jgi:hypothetical protein
MCEQPRPYPRHRRCYRRSTQQGAVTFLWKEWGEDRRGDGCPVERLSGSMGCRMQPEIRPDWRRRSDGYLIVTPSGLTHSLRSSCSNKHTLTHSVTLTHSLTSIAALLPAPAPVPAPHQPGATPSHPHSLTHTAQTKRAALPLTHSLTYSWRRRRRRARRGRRARRARRGPRCAPRRPCCRRASSCCARAWATPTRAP